MPLPQPILSEVSNYLASALQELITISPNQVGPIPYVLLLPAPIFYLLFTNLLQVLNFKLANHFLLVIKEAANFQHLDLFLKVLLHQSKAMIIIIVKAAILLLAFLQESVFSQYTQQ